MTDTLLGVIAALLVGLLIQKGVYYMSVRDEVNRLIEKVNDIETKADSLIALVAGIVEMLRENAADPAEIRALADRLEAQTAEIQGAIDNVPPPPTG